MNELITAIRRYLGDGPAIDLMDVWRAVEAAEAAMAAERGPIMGVRAEATPVAPATPQGLTQMHRTAEVTRTMVEDIKRAMESGLMPLVAGAVAQRASGIAVSELMAALQAWKTSTPQMEELRWVRLVNACAGVMRAESLAPSGT